MFVDFGLKNALSLPKNPLAMADIEALKKKYEEAGQPQVFKFWDTIGDVCRGRLTSQLESVDLDELARLNEELVFKSDGKPAADYSGIEPAPFVPRPGDPAGDPKWARAREAGEEAIRAGKLAAFVVAGGQGTRLGFDAPKGEFPVTPVKGRSLFRVFAEKILAASRRYGAEIPWLVMTSRINDAETRRFFEANSYFGLDRESVIFFSQGLMPAVDFEGRIIMCDRGEVAMTPDGHGGCLRAMVRSGAADALKARGVEYVSYFQVDNPLVNLADPYFLGFHILEGSQMSSKMIPKAYPLEKVGHFCAKDGRLCVVEYSDLPEFYQRQTDASGNLRFLAGSVAIHMFDLAFMEALGRAGGLPFHRADKKVEYVDDDGVVRIPSKPNGVKFEMFVFDALREARNPVIIEGVRADEFSPVKNAEGVDSPETCRRDQNRMFARWLRSAGERVETDADGTPPFNLEVSPLFACDAASFAEAWGGLAEKPWIGEGMYLG